MPNIIVFSFAVASCFFLGLLAIFYIPVNKKGNCWFGVFLFALGSALLSRVIWVENLYGQYPDLIPITELTRFALAPSFFLSIWYYTKLEKINPYILFLHFLPTLLFMLLVSLPYFFSTVTLANQWSDGRLNRVMGQVMHWIIPVQVMIYWLCSFRLLLLHRRTIQLFSAKGKEIDLTWLFGMLLWLLFMLLLWLVLKISANNILDAVSAYCYLFFVLFMGYHLLKQQEVFLSNNEEQEILGAFIRSENVKEQDDTPRLKPETLAYYKQKLDDLFLEEEVFKDPEINLASLGKRLELSLNDLSFLINKAYGMNFYTLINSYRVEKVKQLLLDEKYRHLTILGIAYEAGFTSKSTFNSAFKKITGSTPSEYLKRRPL